MKHQRGTYQTNIGDNDLPITVAYEAVPFHAGSTDGRWGPKLEPDEPAHIEIDSVTGPDGECITLTTAQETAIEEQIGQHLDELNQPHED